MKLALTVLSCAPATLGCLADGIIFHETFESPNSICFSGQGTIDTADGYKTPGALHVVDDSKTTVCQAVSKPIPLVSAAAYRLSGQVKTNNAVTSRSTISLGFFNSEDQLLGVACDQSTVSAEWVRLETTICTKDIPEETAYMRIILEPAAGDAVETGSAWFDDIRLEAIAEVKEPIPPPSPEEEDLTGMMFYIDSSCSNMNKMELPLELTDGNPLTSWRAHEKDTAPALELSWGQARRPGRLVFLPAGEMPETLRIAVFDDRSMQFGKAEVLPVKEIGAYYRQLDLSQLPETRKLMLYFPDPEHSAIAEMRFYAQRPPKENWNGFWIWYTKEAEPHIYRSFRRKFTISGPVKHAWLQGKGDDELWFYVNGRETAGHDITPLIRQGENILAADVRNHRYAGGLLAELDILYADGRTEKIVSDRSWRSAYKPKESTAYRALKFDDSSWEPALEIVRPPYGIWGEVPYTMYTGKQQIRLEQTAFPERLAAGTDFSLQLKLTPEEKLRYPTPVWLRVVREGQLFLEVRLDDGKCLADCDAGETTTLKAVLPVNAFWPDGEYEFSLYLPFTELTGAAAARRVHIINRRQPKPVCSEVRQGKGNMPTWMVNGEAMWNIFYTVPYAAGYPMQTTMIRAFHKAGGRVARILANMTITDDNEVGFAAIDAQAGRVLADSPETFLVLCFYMDRGIVNNFFQQKYPEELAVFDNGVRFNKPSLASERWHTVAGNAVRELVRHVRSSPYADRVVAYIPCGGEEGQWLHHWGGSDPGKPGTFSDYSVPMVRYFRNWLSRKYGSDEMLQKAWGNPHVTLNTAMIPSREERIAPRTGMFRDPQLHRNAIDYGEALSQCINDNLKLYAGIIKDETKRESLVGYFYGHLADVGDGYIAEQAGYVNQQPLLECPDIDFFCGPVEYRWWFRDLGGVASFDYPTPSMLRLHNKLWIQEDDLRTHLYPREYAYSIRRPEESVQVLAREFAKALTGGALMYLHEFGTDQRNWFDDVTYLTELKKLQALGDYAVKHNSLAPVSEIAVIASDKTFHYIRQEKRYVFTDQAGTRGFFQRAGIGRIGAPFEEYLVDAFLDDAMPDYKFYIFLNVFCLTPDEREAIQRKLAGNGATALWFYAPGYIDGTTQDLKHIRKLTGLELDIIHNPRDTRMSLTPDNSLLPDFNASFGMFDEDRQEPIFVVRDDKAETLARLNLSQEVGMACKKQENGVTHYYAAFPMLPPQILRAIAQKAGVHIYLDRYDAVYVCENYLAIHTNRDAGERIITLPQNTAVTQIYPEIKNFGKETSIRFTSARPQTRIYRLN